MSIVWTILIGFVAGLVARAIKPGDDSAGFIITTLIGALKAKGGKKGVAALCIGGGEATAMGIELV